MKQQIMDALAWRYATKTFDAQKKLSDADWQVLEEAARLAPSSFGLQPWRMIHVINPTLRQQLRAAAWNQTQVTDASHLVIFAIETALNDTYVDDFIALTSKTRGLPDGALNEYAGMIKGSVNSRTAEQVQDWNKRQAYIGLGFMLETAALLKIDACPMEGFDAGKFDEILGLKARGLGAVVMCALGYRSDADKMAKAAKVRYAPSHALLEYK